MMGVDKQEARRQRNIHLCVDCGEGAAMSRDFALRKSITFVCEDQNRKRQRLQGDSVFKKMAQPHEQLFFLSYKRMET